MALPATLHEFDVSLSHVDAGVEERLSIRAARHPSESLDRLWLRVLAYCWKWQERIELGPGLCEPDAPDVLARDLTGEEVLWVRVGRPDPARVQQESDRHPRARLAVLFESPRHMDAFVQAAARDGLSRLARVELAAVDPDLLAALATVDGRSARLSLTIVGDHVYVDFGGRTLDGPVARASVL
jgi:uncharacterized protein YaeQ